MTDTLSNGDTLVRSIHCTALPHILNLIDVVKGPYERKARVTPSLFVTLPIVIPLLCVYAPKHPTLTAVVGLLGSCGAVYVLVSISRGRGKKLEECLVQRWGGLPSTIGSAWTGGPSTATSSRNLLPNGVSRGCSVATWSAPSNKLPSSG